MEYLININQSIHVAGFLFEMLGSIFVFQFHLEKRKFPFLRSVIICCSLFACIVFMISMTESTTDFQKYYGYFYQSLTLLILFLIFTLTVWGINRISYYEALFCVTSAYLVEHVVFCIRSIINYLTDSTAMSFGKPLYYTIHILVYLIAYYLFARKIVREGHFETTLLHSLSYSLITLSVVLFMSLIASINDFLIIHSVYGVFCCISVLFYQLRNIEQLRAQEELHINQQLWVTHKAQYEIARENIEIINRKSHDLKYQIKALNLIQDQKERDKAFQSVESAVEIYDSFVETGNEILDTILTEKSLICSENNIRLECIIDGKQLRFMNPIDLFTLFENALMNAIEGAKKLSEDENRVIHILVVERSNVIIIQIENHFTGEIEMNGELPITSKSDHAYHGFGMKSIKYIAEKYHGFINMEAHEQIFLLRITIPRYENNM